MHAQIRFWNLPYVKNMLGFDISVYISLLEFSHQPDSGADPGFLKRGSIVGKGEGFVRSLPEIPHEKEILCVKRGFERNP